MRDKPPRPRYAHVDLSRRVIRLFYDVYNELGVGFLEIVYQRALSIAFAEAGIAAKCEVPVAVHFRGRTVGIFKPDFVVAGTLLVELKATATLDPAHQAQLINYLRVTPYEVGLLLNFGREPEIKRFAFLNDRKHHLR